MTHFSPVAGRRTLAWPAMAALTLALAACATPGPERTPLARLEGPTLGLDAQTESSRIAPRWWLSLQDERLSQLIDQALQGNPGLAVARARVERALALADLSDAAAQPQVGLSAELLRQRYSRNGLVPAPIAGNTWDSGTLQTGLSWSPDFFGQHQAELAAALGQARAAQADALAAASALATQVARSYVGLARLLAQHEVLQRQFRQREALLALSRQRVAAGLDSQVELTQSEAGLPEVQAQIDALDEQVQLARRQLAVLAAQPPEALAGLAPRLDGLVLDTLPLVLGADLLGRRADIAAARWRVEASVQDLQVARAQFYPNINLSAFAGFNALGLSRVLDFGSRQIGVAPALRLPLFDGGRLRAQQSARQAELDAAIAQYNSLVLDAVKEAGDGIASSQAVARQLDTQRQAQAKAERAHALARERFQAGLGSVVAVLAAEGPVLAQQRLLVDLQARAVDTRLGLIKALGGGWSEGNLVLGAGPAPAESAHP